MLPLPMMIKTDTIMNGENNDSHNYTEENDRGDGDIHNKSNMEQRYKHEAQDKSHYRDIA
jgi:hypothetical protein